MKPLNKIDELLEVADSINYHERQLEALKQRQAYYNGFNLLNDSNIQKRHRDIYERLLRILELKYQRILKQINDEN